MCKLYFGVFNPFLPMKIDRRLSAYVCSYDTRACHQFRLLLEQPVKGSNEINSNPRVGRTKRSVSDCSVLFKGIRRNPSDTLRFVRPTG
ncbi:hypothetical protein THII_2961 [Thioploca ingrica]|uniref:Uncharacterized protein n=1 Tax=Thioploca ingrica TaxID=40754 RepID=A0A090AGC1_9GAMM|nr:hypothetical protein THII_2961 [Thioploca ingrica]